MKNVIISLVCIALLGCSQDTNNRPEAKVRPQLSQVVFAGGISLSSSLNGLLKDGQTIKKRREKLRPPLWRIYEVLKSPEIIRPSTIAVTTLVSPLADDSSLGNPALAEMLLLAGFDSVSLASPSISEGTPENILSTADATKRFGMSPLGLLEKGNLQVSTYTLPEVKLAIAGFHISKEGTKANPANPAFTVTPDMKTAAIEQIKGAFDALETVPDVTMVMMSAGIDVSFEVRQDFARSLIDSGVKAVLGHHPGRFDAIETFKDGVIVYNPGYCFGKKSTKRKNTLSFVHKLHFDKTGVKWIEAQPIKMKPKKTVIGMGKKETYGLVERLIEKSKLLKTSVINEYGRGIWESGK